MSRLGRLTQELKRRRVYRVAVVYAVVAFVIWQVAEIAFPALRLPDWALTLVIVLTVVGFPIAVVLAWAFDVTPEGVIRTRPECGAADAADLPARPEAASDRKSIVVLPFDNMSPDPGDAYLSDGLTEEIITGLSCCGPLRVISRNSARALKGTDKDTRTIARELDVGYVLEGSVRKAGNDLRITAQLIDGNTDEHLWSERYSGTLDDVFDMQERLSCSIVDALMLKLSPEEARRLAERPIDNAQAYECYLRARQETWRFTKEALDHARQHLQNGLDIIGENALLLAGMGYVYSQYANIGLEHEEYIEKAEEYARRALALDRESSEAHLVLGFTHQAFRGDQKTSFHHLRQALARNPDDPHALLWLVVGHSIVGRVDEAYPLAEWAARVDPLTPMSVWGKPFLDVMGGRFDVDSEEVAKWYRLEPQNPGTLFFSSLFLAYCGRYEEARSLIAESELPAPGNVFEWGNLLLKHALAGETASFRELLTDDFMKTTRRDAQFSYLQASIHALAGLRTEALDLLSNAVDRGFINYPFIAQHDPLIESIRGEPEFREILKKAKHEWESFDA
jgi:TolB-like protein